MTTPSPGKWPGKYERLLLVMICGYLPSLPPDLLAPAGSRASNLCLSKHQEPHFPSIRYALIRDSLCCLLSDSNGGWAGGGKGGRHDPALGEAEAGANGGAKSMPTAPGVPTEAPRRLGARERGLCTEFCPFTEQLPSAPRHGRGGAMGTWRS